MVISSVLFAEKYELHVSTYRFSFGAKANCKIRSAFCDFEPVDSRPEKLSLAFWSSCLSTVPIFCHARRSVLFFNQNGFAPFPVINEAEFSFVEKVGRGRLKTREVGLLFTAVRTEESSGCWFRKQKSWNFNPVHPKRSHYILIHCWFL